MKRERDPSKPRRKFKGRSKQSRYLVEIRRSTEIGLDPDAGLLEQMRAAFKRKGWSVK